MKRTRDDSKKVKKCKNLTREESEYLIVCRMEWYKERERALAILNEKWMETMQNPEDWDGLQSCILGVVPLYFRIAQKYMNFMWDESLSSPQNFKRELKRGKRFYPENTSTDGQDLRTFFHQQELLRTAKTQLSFVDDDE